MTFTYQKNAGLGEGIGQLGQALSQVIQQRTMQDNFKNITESIKNEELSPTTLQKIISMPGGMDYIRYMAPIFIEQERSRGGVEREQERTKGKILQEQERARGAKDWMEGNVLNPAANDAAPEMSPIAVAKTFKNRKAVGNAPVKITPKEERQSASTNIPGISGVPNMPGAEAANAQEPSEQTEFQQGGLPGMGLNPPSETNRPMLDVQAKAAQAQPNAQPKLAKPTTVPVKEPQYSKEQLFKMTGSPYKEIREQGKAGLQLHSANEARNLKINKPLYEQVDAIRKTMPNKEMALERIDEALKTGEINRFTDWFAETSGMDFTGSTQSQILASAVKTFFLDDLSLIKGGRVNQLIEKNLLRAFPSAGKSPAANQEIAETLYSMQDILKEKVKIFDRLAEKYESLDKVLPINADRIIEKELSPYVAKRMKELSKVRKEIRSGKITTNTTAQFRRALREVSDTPPPEGSKWVVFPGSDIREVPLDRISAAIKEGHGKILEEEENE